jgi:hypothetical protein
LGPGWEPAFKAAESLHSSSTPTPTDEAFQREDQGEMIDVDQTNL